MQTRDLANGSNPFHGGQNAFLPLQIIGITVFHSIVSTEIMGIFQTKHYFIADAIDTGHHDKS